MRKLIIASFVFFGAACWPVSANQYPFALDPDSFLEFMNSSDRKWGKSSSYYLFNPVGCESIEFPPSLSYYYCKVDWKEKTSLGERTCVNQVASYDSKENKYYLNQYTSTIYPRSDYLGECGEWVVEEIGFSGYGKKMPSDDKIGTNRPNPADIQSELNSSKKCLEKTSLIMAFSGVFMIGGAIGIVSGSLVSKRHK